jgi:hypothetical protein
MAQGEGFGAAVGKGLPKVGAGLAVAGLAYEAGNRVLDFAAEQRRANMEYQSVLGGSNAEGFGERAKQFGFTLQNRVFGQMGGKDAEAIYKGAMELYGTDRTMRNRYQDVSTGLYKSLGMSPEESGRVLKLAAEEGVTALDDIGEALKGVTKSAREAGMNAKVARQTFEESFAAMSKVYGGQGATVMAASRAEVATSYGHELRGAVRGSSNLAYTAHTMGMTQGQLINLGSTTEGAAIIEAKTEAELKQQLEMFAPGITGLINGWAQTNNVQPGQMTEFEADALVPLIYEHLGNRVDFVVGALQNNPMVGSFAPGSVDQSNVAELIAQIFLGKSVAQEALKKSMAPKKGVDVKGEVSKAGGTSKYAREQLGMHLQSMGQEVKFAQLMAGETTLEETGFLGSDRSRAAYAEWRSGGGEQSPALEAMFQDWGKNKNRQFIFSTKEGERTMTLEAAIGYGYIDQVVFGTAREAGTNRTVADEFGFKERYSSVKSEKKSAKRTEQVMGKKVTGMVGQEVDEKRAAFEKEVSQLGLSPEDSADLYKMTQSGSELKRSAASKLLKEIKKGREEAAYQQVNVNITTDRKLDGWLKVNQDGSTASDQMSGVPSASTP